MCNTNYIPVSPLSPLQSKKDDTPIVKMIYKHHPTELVVTLAGRVREVAELCPDWRRGLEKLFPEAFEMLPHPKAQWHDDWL